jgi:hypothetical protein
MAKKVDRWFSAGKKLATSKGEYHVDEPERTRRIAALRSRGGDLLAVSRSLQAVANVNKSRNPKAAKIMAADAKYFRERYEREKK